MDMILSSLLKFVIVKYISNEIIHKLLFIHSFSQKYKYLLFLNELSINDKINKIFLSNIFYTIHYLNYLFILIKKFFYLLKK